MAQSVVKPVARVVSLMSPTPSIRRIPTHRLWIAASAALDNPATVFATGIEAVVCVAAERLPDPWPRDLLFLRCPISDDGENDPRAVERAVEIVAGLIADDVPTLLVCSQGRSRSVAIAAAAIARHEESASDLVLQRIAAGQPTDVSAGLWTSVVAASVG